MKAIYLPELSSNIKPNGIISIPKDRSHHLKKVLRVKPQEVFLGLNGIGLVAQCSFEFEAKAESDQVKILSINNSERKFHLDLFLGLPKKDAFESTLKSSTEIGLGSIFPLQSEFVQFSKINHQRMTTILEGSLVQSNNPWLPRLENLQKFSVVESLSSNYKTLFYFCSRGDFSCTDHPDKSFEFTGKDKIAYLIGPEGGFSNEEEQKVMSLKNVKVINLPTNILKTPNAASFACGFLLGKYLI